MTTPPTAQDAPEASPRIQQLRDLCRELSVVQEGLLYGHLLGLLSGLVDQDQWDEALEMSLTHLERIGLR